MDNMILKNSIAFLMAVNFMSALFLLFFPKPLKKANDFFNKWFSSRQFFKVLDAVVIVDEKIYKNRKILGVLSLVLIPFLKNISVWFIPAGIIISVFLLIFPGSLKRTNDFLNKRISTRKLTKPLEIIKNIDDKIYEKRKMLGILSLIIVSFLIHCYIIL